MTDNIKSKNKTWGIISAALSALSFALCPAICKYAYRFTWTGTSLTCMGTAMAALMIFLYSRAKGISLKLQKNERRAIIAAGILNWIGILAYNIAAGMIPAGTTTALNYLYPALVMITGVVFFSYKLTVIRVLSVLLNMTGVFMFFETGGHMLMGCILGICSAVFYGAYSLVVEHTVLDSINTFKLGFYVTSISAVLCLVLGLCTGQMAFPREGMGYFWAFALALTSNVMGVLFFQSAVQNIGAAQTSLTATLEPLTGIILGAILFAEAITWKTGAGCVLIMAGIILNAVSTMKGESSNE